MNTNGVTRTKRIQSAGFINGDIIFWSQIPLSSALYYSAVALSVWVLTELA